MLKALLAALLLVSSALPISAKEPQPSKYVNLNVPDAFEKLRASSPVHYQKVQNILQGLTKHPSSDVPRWLRTSFDATSVSYSDILLTTSPPQRDLSFVLDYTMYRARVTLTREGAQIFTIKNY